MDSPITSVDNSRPESPPPQRRAHFAAWLKSVVVFLWKSIFGMVLCQTLAGSVAVLGWSYRLMQRSALKAWWKAGKRGQGESFAEFVRASHLSATHEHWPNWLVRQNFAREMGAVSSATRWARVQFFVTGLWTSLWLNVKTGVKAIFNTWVLTMPACLLWWFSWYDGWNNSFGKGYEQAVVGPSLGMLGVILFIAAMFYVPMAQARQAVTGNWRSFYQFRLVWSLIRRRWLACLGLASLFSALSVPVMILKTIPGFLPQINPSLLDLSPTEALKFINSYFFWSTVLVFPAFVVVRLASAHLYASALLAAYQRGAVPEEALAEVEWDTLHRLDLLHVRITPVPSALIRALAWTGSKAARFAVGIALALVWFTFVAQIYISEFLTYHRARGWLNQPLVQLPWFNYAPQELREEKQPRWSISE